MGRYQAKKRQEEKDKKKKSTTQRTFTTGRRGVGGKNRKPVKPALKYIPASKRPKDMQAGKVYGDAGQPKAPKLPPKPTAKPTPKPAPKKTPPKKTPPKTTPKKSAVSTYRDKKDTKGTSVGRHRTLKEHRAAVAAAKLLKKGKNVGPVANRNAYASAMKKKKDKK